MKKIIRRGAAATLAAVTLVTSAAVPVRAAAPRVQVDETMYVNLDYYGTATQINVVKGCTTNGLTEYTDYGTYDKVVNDDGTVTYTFHLRDGIKWSDGQPVTAGQIGAAGAMTALLKDALRRARKHPILKDIASRMKLVEGDSVSCMEKLMDPVDVIYLDPMFPKRQKSGLINKKLQLIQKLEPPCSEEKDLFDAAIKAGPSRIIVKRPLKSVCLDGREPSYILKGKAIRYDCYVM